MSASMPSRPSTAPSLRRTLVYIVVSGLLGVVGQLLLKRALVSIGPLALRPETALTLALNPLVLVGLAVYVGGTFFWLLALSGVDLSFAYPFASLNYVYVLLASWLLLGEQPSPVRLIGVVAICVGVWAISRSPASTTSSDRRGSRFIPPSVPEVETASVGSGANRDSVILSRGEGSPTMQVVVPNSTRSFAAAQDDISAGVVFSHTGDGIA